MGEVKGLVACGDNEVLTKMSSEKMSVKSVDLSVLGDMGVRGGLANVTWWEWTLDPERRVDWGLFSLPLADIELAEVKAGDIQREGGRPRVEGSPG